MDKILITDLEVHYRVGVTERERAQPQLLLLTIEMARDLSGAAASDDLAATIDYQAVCDRLLRLGEERSWALIESVASEIAGMVLAEFRAAEVTVEVKKFVIRQTRYVSVRMTRQAAG